MQAISDRRFAIKDLALALPLWVRPAGVWHVQQCNRGGTGLALFLSQIPGLV